MWTEVFFQVDGHGLYWEHHRQPHPQVPSPSEYVATVEVDDFEDYLARALREATGPVLIFTYAAYEQVNALHEEMGVGECAAATDLTVPPSPTCPACVKGLTLK